MLSLPSSTREASSLGRRIVGVGAMLFGMIGIAFSLLYMATLRWFGFPRTTTQFHLIVCGVVALCLGVAGYRMAADKWSGATQVPHTAAAFAGLWFVAVWLQRLLFGTPPVQSPPLWAGLLALFALGSRIYTATRRHSAIYGAR